MNVLNTRNILIAVLTHGFDDILNHLLREPNRVPFVCNKISNI